MSVFLKGLSLQFYRGIGSTAQQLFPFKRFNFFIGANNAGKSTILNFITDYIPLNGSTKRKSSDTPALEQHRGKVSGTLKHSIAVPKDEFKQAVRAAISQGAQESVKRYVDVVVDAIAEGGAVWIVVDQVGLTRFAEPPQPSSVRNALLDREWEMLWHYLTGQSSGGLMQHWVPETLNKMAALQTVSFPPVKLIPALRQMGPAGGAFSDYTGAGLIDRLAEIQSPDHDKRHDRQLFDRINSFLSEVTGKAGAQIEVPHNRQHVLVHMDDKVLPLSSLGMGIHEVIMIAAFCTLTEDQIVCMEEPEIHLHPLLQRKLVAYLQNNTSNQYFVATHSASFIDTPGAAIFHVVNDGAETRISETLLKSDRHNLCMDLGYKASDIVQANAVIWVEGPSDRIYVRHWLEAERPDLKEGIHYSIMFYGGRLLSHLSADSEELGEFIALRALNQHLALIMDSDRHGARSTINPTKQRLESEFSKGTGFCWITKGREIENYVDHTALQAAVQEVYPTAYGSPGDGGQYDHALYFRRAAAKKRRKAGATQESDNLIETTVDKVAVAKRVCRMPANLDILDLQARIGDLVKMIDHANR